MTTCAGPKQNDLCNKVKLWLDSLLFVVRPSAAMLWGIRN